VRARLPSDLEPGPGAQPGRPGHLRQFVRRVSRAAPSQPGGIGGHPERTRQRHATRSVLESVRRAVPPFWSPRRRTAGEVAPLGTGCSVRSGFLLAWPGGYRTGLPPPPPSGLDAADLVRELGRRDPERDICRLAKSMAGTAPSGGNRPAVSGIWPEAATGWLESGVEPGPSWRVGGSGSGRRDRAGRSMGLRWMLEGRCLCYSGRWPLPCSQTPPDHRDAGRCRRLWRLRAVRRLRALPGRSW